MKGISFPSYKTVMALHLWPQGCVDEVFWLTLNFVSCWWSVYVERESPTWHWMIYVYCCLWLIWLWLWLSSISEGLILNSPSFSYEEFLCMVLYGQSEVVLDFFQLVRSNSLVAELIWSVPLLSNKYHLK